jgi:spore germination protein YaaH
LSLAGLCACTSTTISPSPAPTRGTIWGFTAPWDPRSDSSVRLSESHLAALIGGSLQLDSLTDQPTRLYPDERAVASGTVERIALVTTFSGDRFHPDVIRRLAANNGALNLAAARLATLVARSGYRTALLDFEDQSKADLPSLLRVVRTISDTLRAHGSHVGVELPGADTSAYPSSNFLPFADFIAVTLYDEHWSRSAPGPVASPAWVRRVLARRVADVGSAHLIAVLPVYSYVWRNGQPAEMLSFADARHLASEANVELLRDPTSQSLHAIQPASWELWMSDATLLNALEAEVRSLGVERIALRRLGLEDPAIWSNFNQTIIKSR